MNRIDFLREKVLNKSHSNDEFFYLFYKHYSNSTIDCEYQRYADSFYHAFSNLTPHITDGELIVGECESTLTEETLREWEEKYKEICKARCAKAGGGQDSHMAVDYELLLSRGANGIIAKIDEYLKNCTENSKSFYVAAKKSLLAIVKHSENYSILAESLAQNESDPIRRKELLEIARICKKVPAEPAESFYEAVQSVHFLSYCLSLNPFRFAFQQFRFQEVQLPIL